jgi:hypothetical protein
MLDHEKEIGWMGDIRNDERYVKDGVRTRLGGRNQYELPLFVLGYILLGRLPPFNLLVQCLVEI